MPRLFKPLDRYVWVEYWKIFIVTALGFPILIIVTDLTENVDKYLNRKLPAGQIALSYLYFIPETMFQVLPAAVLFATVFSIGSFTRHSEITAAKASGISFYRLTLPIYVGAIIASGIGLVIGEYAPHASATRLQLLEEQKYKPGADRYNFAFAAEEGRVYKVNALSLQKGVMDGIEIERKGSGPEYPTYVISAETAAFDTVRGWMLEHGVIHVLPEVTGLNVTVSYDSLRDNRLRETPLELTANPEAPAEMGYQALGRFIAALERSGGDANELRVERALKIAIPVTCIIIALFGAPLATSSQRGGAAYGVGISLAVTVLFLVLIQLTKAVGSKGLIAPELAAWTPNMLFGIVGLAMLARVRT